MAQQSKARQNIVSRVMHEFKHGDLESGRGGKVRNPRQAIAIALSEAGASNQQSPSENKRKLKQTKAKEVGVKQRNTGAAEADSGQPAGADTTSRHDLYHRARQANIPGRSRMSKDELRRALAEHRA